MIITVKDKLVERKKLMDEGIDLQNESNWYKYSHSVLAWLIFGDGLKVEIKKTV